MALAAATCAMFFITPDVPAAEGHTAATSSPTTHSGAKSKKGGARTSGPSAKALAAEIDSLVAQALAASKQATRGLGSSGPIAFDGVAWETGEGVDAGTSPVGTELSDAIRTSLAQHGVSTEVAGVGARGLGVGRILKGGFRLLKSGLELSLVVSDASGLPVGRVSKILTNVVGLSSGAMHLEEVLPPDSENLKGLVRLMRKTVLAGHSQFPLRVSTDRGNHPAYLVGEQLHVLVQADHDCYVRLYHVDWSGKELTLIFPNREDRDSRLIAGTRKRFPADGTGVVFEVSEPAGVDAIVAIASERPFEDERVVASELAEPGGGSASQSRGITSAGPYLVAEGVSDERAKDILSRGLIVKLPAAGTVPRREAARTSTNGDSSQTTDAVPDSSSTAGGNVSATSQSVRASSPSEPAPLARAVCFFTTLRRRTPLH